MVYYAKLPFLYDFFCCFNLSYICCLFDYFSKSLSMFWQYFKWWNDLGTSQLPLFISRQDGLFLSLKNLHYSGTLFSASSCWIACLMLSCLVEHSISSFLMRILEAKYFFLSWPKLTLFLFPHLHDSLAGYRISCWK